MAEKWLKRLQWKKWAENKYRCKHTQVKLFFRLRLATHGDLNKSHKFTGSYNVQHGSKKLGYVMDFAVCWLHKENAN